MILDEGEEFIDPNRMGFPDFGVMTCLADVTENVAQAANIQCQQ